MYRNVPQVFSCNYYSPPPTPPSADERSKRNDPTMSSINIDSFSDNTSLNGEFFRTLQSKLEVLIEKGSAAVSCEANRTKTVQKTVEHKNYFLLKSIT